MTPSDLQGLVPADSFRVRLAIVRALMGWNYAQAEAATGIGGESWRLWEKGERHCSDVTGVSRTIAQVTPYSATWIAFGGPLAAEESDPPRLRRRKVAAAGVRTSEVSSASTCGYVTSEAGYAFEDNLVMAA